MERAFVPFNKRAVSTAAGAADGTTVVSQQVPSAGEFGLGEADDFWNDSMVRILTGDMASQERRVTDWVQATGTLTLDHRFNNPHVSLLTVDAGIGAFTVSVADASVFTTGAAYIWNPATGNTEAVFILLVNTVLNTLTLLNPLVNAYTVAGGSAVSMSPSIVAGVQFVLMPPQKTQDSGVHTNPERWLHNEHWDCNEVTINIAGAGGQQNLGAAVGAGAERRIREITIRHAGTNNTVVTILIAGGAIRLTIDVPAQTTRVWSSEDGRVFTAAQQPAAQSSDVTGGNTFVSASGVEAVPT